MYQSKGSVNGLRATFNYAPPATRDDNHDDNRPFEPHSPASPDLDCGLRIHVHAKESPNGETSLHLPNPTLIVLLDDDVDRVNEKDNSRYLLLFSGDPVVEKSSRPGGLKVADVVPNYKPGRFWLTSPPQALKDALFFSRREHPAWLDVAGGKSELTVVLSTAGGDGGGRSKAEVLYQSFVRPVLREIGLIESICGKPDCIGSYPIARYNVIYTRSHDTIKDFITSKFSSSPRRCVSQQDQTILLLSGDTSLFELLNALPTPLSSYASASKVHLSVLPTGTGNALCSSIYLNQHPLSAFLLGSPKKLPLFHTTFSPGSRLLSQSGKRHSIPASGLYGAVVLSWAFHASLVADSDASHYRRKYPGPQRFQVAARENLDPHPHLYNGRITVQRQPDGPWEDLQQNLKDEDRGYWYFLATLVSRLEETFVINPDGRPLDGKLRVVHFAKLQHPAEQPSSPASAPAEEHSGAAQSVIRTMHAAYDGGKHVELPGVGYERGGVEAVKVEVHEGDYSSEAAGGLDKERNKGRWRRICIDGAIIEVEKGGWVEVRNIPEGLEGVHIIWRK